MYIVRTSIDNKDAARLMAQALITTRSAVSVHITEVESIHYWDNRMDNMTEYEVNALCEDLIKTKEIIEQYHTYELPEFIYYEIKSSKEIEKWCKDWCK